MSEVSVADKVKAIIVNKLAVDASEVTPTAKIKEDLGADSLDAVELVMECEKQFNFSIIDEHAEKLLTVGDIIEYVEKWSGN